MMRFMPTGGVNTSMEMLSRTMPRTTHGRPAGLAANADRVDREETDSEAHS